MSKELATSKNTYGALYNWYATTVNGGVLCPEGWHVPSLAEWDVLSDYLINNGYGYEGSGEDIAKSLSARTNWNVSFTPGTPGNDPTSNNRSGFSGIPGGRRGSEGIFDGFSDYGNWWSSSAYTVTFPVTHAWHKTLSTGDNKASSETALKAFGYSVRCVKDIF